MLILGLIFKVFVITLHDLAEKLTIIEQAIRYMWQ